jgi:hypothetical protein
LRSFSAEAGSDACSAKVCTLTAAKAASTVHNPNFIDVLRDCAYTGAQRPRRGSADRGAGFSRRGGNKPITKMGDNQGSWRRPHVGADHSPSRP